MESYIKERTLSEAEYILQTKQTIRSVAKNFGVSKSTVHNDLSKRLKCYDKCQYEKVKLLLNCNFEEKHIRGEISTKNKYLKLKKIIKNT